MLGLLKATLTIRLVLGYPPNASVADDEGYKGNPLGLEHTPSFADRFSSIFFFEQMIEWSHQQDAIKALIGESR